MAPVDDVRLQMEKQADWYRRSTYALAHASGTIAFVIVVLYVPIHPFILAFLALVLVIAGASVAGRISAMGRESLTVTRSEVVVVKGRERRYAIGPSTRVHLDVGKRSMTERIGPLKEVSFDSKGEGISPISVANGWTREQVEQVYRLIAPLVEPKEMKTTIRFRRYMTDLH